MRVKNIPIVLLNPTRNPPQKAPVRFTPLKYRGRFERVLMHVLTDFRAQNGQETRRVFNNPHLCARPLEVPQKAPRGFDAQNSPLLGPQNKVVREDVLARFEAALPA